MSALPAAAAIACVLLSPLRVCLWTRAWFNEKRWSVRGGMLRGSLLFTGFSPQGGDAWLSALQEAVLSLIMEKGGRMLKNPMAYHPK